MVSQMDLPISTPELRPSSEEEAIAEDGVVGGKALNGAIAIAGLAPEQIRPAMLEDKVCRALKR